MKTAFYNSLCLILFWLLLSTQVNAQVSIFKPKPAKNPNLAGSTPWTAICAGVGGFNQYYATISWAGTPNSDNEFILELSNSNGNFSNPVELARASDQNTNSLRSFDIEFSIPKNTRGNGYKLRVRSTSPADSQESSKAYNIYYLDVTQNLNISQDGSGIPPGSICSTGPINIKVDNINKPESYQYLWYRNGTLLAYEKSHILNVSKSGIYQAYLDYGNICSGSSNANSNFIDIKIGNLGQGIAITPPLRTSLCPSSEDIETLNINITNPNWNYQWYKNGTKIPGATAPEYHVNASIVGFEGDYQVEISAIGICNELSPAVTMTNAESFTVTRENAAKVLVLPGQSKTLSVSTTALSPTYQWYRNSTAIPGAIFNTLDITEGGEYYTEITQNKGSCTDSITKKSEKTIAEFPKSFEIRIDYISDYSPCESTSTVLEVATIYAIDELGNKTNVTTNLIDSLIYQWQKDGEDIIGETSKHISLTSAIENGVYSITTSLSEYQERSNLFSVNLLTSETVEITSTSMVYCDPNDIVTISSTTDLSSEIFSWEKDGTSVNTTNTSLHINSPGKYQLVLYRDGCTLISNEIEITTPDVELIKLNVDGDVVFPEGSSKTVIASGANQYRWFDSNNKLVSSTDSMTFTEQGTFLLMATINSCEIALPINAIYLEPKSIPNVITPNGDGANDLWVVPNSYANKKDITITIYNKKGEQLLNETDYRNNWPQSSLEFPKQNMVFYYVIKSTSKVLKQGTITVII